MDELCNQTSPSSLVGSAQSSTIITVEIFEEVDMILEMWIMVQQFRISIDRSFTRCIALENPDKSVVLVFTK